METTLNVTLQDAINLLSSRTNQALADLRAIRALEDFGLDNNRNDIQDALHPIREILTTIDNMCLAEGLSFTDSNPKGETPKYTFTTDDGRTYDAVSEKKQK